MQCCHGDKCLRGAGSVLNMYILNTPLWMLWTKAWFLQNWFQWWSGTFSRMDTGVTTVVPFPFSASQLRSTSPVRNKLSHESNSLYDLQFFYVSCRAVLSLVLSHQTPRLQPHKTWKVGMGIIWQYSVIPGHYNVPSWERDPVMCASVCDWSGSSLSPSDSHFKHSFMQRF